MKAIEVHGSNSKSSLRVNSLTIPNVVNPRFIINQMCNNISNTYVQASVLT